MTTGIANQKTETKSEKDARMAWFREAKFGMFIHWGLYAIPAGKWGDSTHHGEWIRETAKIPLEEYNQLQPQFNPTKFDANEWMKLAKHAGMKYVVTTSKHHDGFALFDSKVSEWDVTNTPFKRDILKEIATAARANGLVNCFYHSIMDWHHPDYLPRRSWETNRPVGAADMDNYVKYLSAQVTELLTNYGPVGIMWFDGEWESTWNHTRGQALYDLCRKLQPRVIVNNRVDVGRGGMAGMSDAGFAGDYGTPEQEVPAQGLPGVDWESCITMNGNWGYNAADKNFKSTNQLIELLMDIISKGGNLLLNVGPKADGTFPAESVQALQEIGDWMKVNGEAVYGTTASPFPQINPAWRCSRKGNTLYVTKFMAGASNEVVLPGLANDISKSALLGGGTVKVSRKGSDLHLTFPPQSRPLVAKLELKGSPVVYETPRIEAESQKFVTSLPVSLVTSSKGLEIRYTTDGSDPKASSPIYTKPIVLKKTTTIKAKAFHRGKTVSAMTSSAFTQVKPDTGQSINAVAGLSVNSFEGNFSKCDELKQATNSRSSTFSRVSLEGVPGKEYFGMILDGNLKVDQTDLIRFRLTSDDGSRLFINGKLVVDNDGLHGAESKVGSAALSTGWHSIRVEYFNKTGGQTLKLEWASLGDKFVEVPATHLATHSAKD